MNGFRGRCNEGENDGKGQRELDERDWSSALLKKELKTKKKHGEREICLRIFDWKLRNMW